MLLIAVGFTVILLRDLPALVREKSKGGLALFLLLFLTSLTLAVLIQLDVKIPSVLLLLGQVFKSLGITY